MVFIIDPKLLLKEDFDSNYEPKEESPLERPLNLKPKVSLSIISSTAYIRPLHIEGILQKAPITILVNSSISLRFVDVYLARQLNLYIIPKIGFTCSLPRYHILHYEGIIKSLHV